MAHSTIIPITNAHHCRQESMVPAGDNPISIFSPTTSHKITHLSLPLEVGSFLSGSDGSPSSRQSEIFMYAVGMTYRASQTSRFLPVNAIAEGAHIGLDVRNCKLRLAKAMPDSSVLVEDYKIRSTDDALDLFAYLQRNKGRFRSVKII